MSYRRRSTSARATLEVRALGLGAAAALLLRKKIQQLAPLLFFKLHICKGVRWQRGPMGVSRIAHVFFLLTALISSFWIWQEVLGV